MMNKMILTPYIRQHLAVFQSMYRLSLCVIMRNGTTPVAVGRAGTHTATLQMRRSELEAE